MKSAVCRRCLLWIVGIACSRLALAAVGRWTPLGPYHGDGTPVSVSALAAAPNGEFLYAAGDGVFRSNDGGARWIAADGLSESRGVLSIAVDPATPSTLYASTFAGLFRSTDAGLSWVPVWTDQVVYVIAVDAASPRTLYAGTGPMSNGNDSSVFKSTDGGANWTRVLSTADYDGFVSLAIDPVSPVNVYAGSERGQFFRSADAGQTWSEVPGYWEGRIGSIAIDPSSPWTVYAASDQTVVPMGPGIGNVVKSTDFGQTWQALSGIPRFNVAGMTLDPRSPSHVYAGVDGVVYASADGGVTWSPVGDDAPSLYAEAFLFDPLRPGHLYVVSGEVFDIDLGGRSPVQRLPRPLPRTRVLLPRP